MLRIHFMQQWFTLSDPAMQEACFDTPLYREFAKLDAHTRLPDESTILRFRHRLEEHKLAEQSMNWPARPTHFAGPSGSVTGVIPSVWT